MSRVATTLLVLAVAGCSRGAVPVEIKVTRNGFEPAVVRVEKGKPVDLLVTRTVEDTCATEIVIPDAGLNVPLPLGKPVEVSFTPPHAGRLRVSCAMGLFGGYIEVQ